MNRLISVSDPVDFTEDCTSLVDQGSYAKSPNTSSKDENVSSESGWTKYLEPSMTESTSLPKTDLRSQVMARIALDVLGLFHNQCHERQGRSIDNNQQEDPSTASDASSGPEHPAGYYTDRGWEAQPEKPMFDKDILNEFEEFQACLRHNASCESPGNLVPTCEPRQLGMQYPMEVKRRKKPCQTPRHNHVKDIEEIDAINDRFATLQRLIPHIAGAELGPEELLIVATEYVKSLERIVQSFLKLHQCAFEGVKAGVQLEPTHHITAFQDNNVLCLMPVSKLICQTRF